MYNPERDTLVLIDLSVAMHQLEESLRYTPLDSLVQEVLGDYKDYRTAEIAVLKQLTTVNMDWLYSLEWLGALKPRYAKVVLLRDWKHNMRLSKDTHAANETGWDIGGEFHDLWGYWRHEYLLRLENARVLDAARDSKRKRKSTKSTANSTKPAKGVAYKAGRSHASANFACIKTKTEKISKEDGWDSLGFPGYEADDIAGAIVHLNSIQPNPRQILLVTTDTDWLGLVDTQDVSWFCMFGHYPRLRDTPDLLEDWSSRRLKVPCRTGADIFRVKSTAGDSTDNLPGGCPDIISSVVDLLNPPHEFMLWNNSAYRAELVDVLNRASSPVDSGKGLVVSEVLESVGLKPFIRQYEPTRDAPKIFTEPTPADLFDL